MSIQVTNFGNTLGLPAGYVEAITAIVDEEIKFCVQNPTTNGTTGQVPVFSNPQLIRPTNVVIDNTDSLSIGGTLTIGNNVPATNYTLPSAIGVPQQVLQVPAIGNELEWANNSTTVPTFLNTLTVDSLSQGPNALTPNYTFPNYAPPANSVLASSTTYVMTFAVNATIRFRVDTIRNGTISFFVTIPIGTYLLSDIFTQFETEIRTVFSANNVIADIIFGYDNLTDRFSIVLTAVANPSNITTFYWEAYQVFPVPNNNNLFGIGSVLDITLTPTPIPQTAPCPNAPIGVSLGTDCVWRSLSSIQVNSIQSESGGVSIQCEDVGAGQSGIISYGDYNINNGSINNCGNINALDNCNITTGTTQIVNGLSQIKLDANNALNTQLTSVNIKPTDYTLSQKFGFVEYPRHQITTTNQTFYNNTGSEKLRVDNSGVKINNVFYMPATVGNAGALLTSNGAGLSTWEDPVVINPFDQSLNTFDDVVFNSVATNSVDNLAALAIGSNLAPTINIGNAASNTNITGRASVKVNGNTRLDIGNSDTNLLSQDALTGPNGSRLALNNNGTFTLSSYFAGNGAIDCNTNSMEIVGPQARSNCIYTDATITIGLFNGAARIDREIMDATSQTFKDGNSVDRIKLDNTNVTINGLYTLPTNAGVDGEVLTRATGTSTVWNRPQIYSIFSQIVNQTVANTVVDTTIIGGGTPTSTLTIAPNFFTPGMTFRYTTGGLFQTSANNINARFRLRNSGVLFDSGLLVFSNRVIPPTPWNVEATFAYMGGTVIVTNFNFQYNAGNDARGFTSQQSNNTFDATVSNTLNFTIEWSVASANNSITTNFGIIQKIY